jgi:hypothetical protein
MLFCREWKRQNSGWWTGFGSFFDGFRTAAPQILRRHSDRG